MRGNDRLDNLRVGPGENDLEALGYQDWGISVTVSISLGGLLLPPEVPLMLSSELEMTISMLFRSLLAPDIMPAFSSVCNKQRVRHGAQVVREQVLYI